MKKAIYIVSFLILALTSLIIYEAMNVNTVESFNITMRPTKACDMHTEDCIFKVPKLGKAIVKISPRPIQLNKSLKLEVKTDFSDDVEVWIDFLGLDMEMGFNRTKLKFKDNKYQADGYLPTCTEKKMRWKATVLIKKNDITYGYEYRFGTRLNEK